MTKSKIQPSAWFAKPFFFCMTLTVVLYLLRGMAILTFLPGSIWLGLISLCLGLALLYTWEKSRRW
jgi:hypothetical protein